MRKNKFKSFASRLNKDGDHPEKISFESPEEQAEYDKLDFLWNRCLPEETGEPDIWAKVQAKINADNTPVRLALKSNKTARLFSILKYSAVAANECFAALGSDTGGSIRQPASYCGVVGLKPTYGTVSRYGLIAYGSSLDQIGPLCKDVTDCATIMEAIAGKDDKDSTSIGRDDYSFTKALVDDVKGMRIGIPRDYFGEGLDPEVKEAVLNAAKKFLSKGDKVKITLRFRGREMAHMNASKHILDDFAASLGEIAVVEKAPKVEGRSISMVLAEKKS